MEATKELLKLLLPDDLRDSFEIVDVKKVSNTITITLEEHDRIMHPVAGHEYEKNGFYEAKRVEDYPIRSSKVVLMVKCRRWIDRTTGQSVGKEYDTVAHGTRMSKELALFFSGTTWIATLCLQIQWRNITASTGRNWKGNTRNISADTGNGTSLGTPRSGYYSRKT